jgi:hypothetical protein
MSDIDATTAAPDAHADHATGHGHEAPAEPLGPADVGAWMAALLGGFVGLLVALALFAASSS